MTMLRIVGVGMRTAVGLDAPSTCAALRCGLGNAEETAFLDRGGKPVIGSRVPCDTPLRGRSRLLALAAAVAQEAAGSVAGIPLILVGPAAVRMDVCRTIDAASPAELSIVLGRQSHPADTVVAEGGACAALGALAAAAGMIARGQTDAVLIIGVDSLLIGPELSEGLGQRRIRTASNAEGYQPGEGAVALLLRAAQSTGGPRIRGQAGALEAAVPGSGKPLRATGMTTAVRAALKQAGISASDLRLRISCVNGEPELFKEEALTAVRLRGLADQSVWVPASSTGSIGAAGLLLALGWHAQACRRGYAPPGPTICLGADDHGPRAAVIVEAD